MNDRKNDRPLEEPSIGREIFRGGTSGHSCSGSLQARLIPACLRAPKGGYRYPNSCDCRESWNCSRLLANTAKFVLDLEMRFPCIRCREIEELPCSKTFARWDETASAGLYSAVLAACWKIEAEPDQRAGLVAAIANLTL